MPGEFDMDFDLDKLLIPIAVESAVGPYLKGDRTYKQIQESRREEDASLPRGIWTTDLKRANWPEVERLARSALALSSKDLMIAIWLGEAWIHLRKCRGLESALILIERLCHQYWQEIHPMPIDGDNAYRLAPLQWMDEQYAVLTRRNASLFKCMLADGLEITLDWWQAQERLMAAPTGKGSQGARSNPESEQKRALISKQLSQLRQELGSQKGAKRLRSEMDSLASALAAVERLEGFLATELGAEAPTLTALRNHLCQLIRLGKELSEMCPPTLTETDPASTMTGVQDEMPGVVPTEAQTWHGREDAYRQLAAVAAYLSRVEPHSPVPYLIRKAVAWGHMPLDELLAELHQEDSQAKRLWTLMGIFKS
jgi:type VI secretion system protein ImpA